MRTDTAAPSGHGSETIARWASRAAASASAGRAKTESVESPSPWSGGRTPWWRATAAAISSAWRATAGPASGDSRQSRVDATTSESRKVTIPTGDSPELMRR